MGSMLANYLIQKNMEVVVYDKLIYGAEGLIPLINHPHFQLVIGDIRNTSLLKKAVEKTDIIVHLAAIVGEDACLVDPRTTEEVNTQATYALAKLAIESGTKRFIFTSTCSNYGKQTAIVFENSPLKPVSLYAQTKVAAEKYILSISPKLLTACVLRFGTLCGLSPRMRFDLLVNDIGRSAATGKSISLFDLDSWRPFLHVCDASEAIQRCFIAPKKIIAGSVFNVVGENYQKRKLAKLVEKHYPAIKIIIEESKVDSRSYRVSSRLIAQKLKFHPKYTVEEAFAEVSHAIEKHLLPDAFRTIYQEVLPKV